MSLDQSQLTDILIQRASGLPEYQPDNATEYRRIILYAIRHDYPEVLDSYIGQMLQAPLVDLLEILPPNYLVAWVGLTIQRRTPFLIKLNFECHHDHRRHTYRTGKI